jgi:hypothetical protein
VANAYSDFYFGGRGAFVEPYAQYEFDVPDNVTINCNA